MNIVEQRPRLFIYMLGIMLDKENNSRIINSGNGNNTHSINSGSGNNPRSIIGQRK